MSEGNVMFATVPGLQPVSNADQRWKHYLSDIPAHVTSRLTIFGILYIFLGLLSIGLEAGLWVNGVISYFIGFINGIALLFVGIVSIILARQQIYVLTTLFIVVFAQLFGSLVIFTDYALFFFLSEYRPYHCTSSYFYDYCTFGTVQIILTVDLVHVFSTGCLVISNLITIFRERRFPASGTVYPYIVYTQQNPTGPVCFQNPMINP